jgi:arabinofuranan 3-O-arabinosyltransferase
MSLAAPPTALPLPGPPSEQAAQRLRAVGFAFAAGYLVFLAGAGLQGQFLLDPLGRPIANDFVNIYAAGRLVLEGNPSAAYVIELLKQAEDAAVGYAFSGYYNWPYPPTFLFVAAAVALLPFIPAALAWLAVTFVLYAASLRAIIGTRLGILLACAFAGTIWNVTAGQNGFLTAALIGGALVSMERRPIVAGILLGLLTYKPQFGLLFPLILVADRRWSVIASAALTALALFVASSLAFGPESWRMFVDSVFTAGTITLSEGLAGLHKQQSLLGLMRFLGAGMTVAATAHIVLAFCCAACTILIWRRRVAFEIKAAALGVSAMLATPYLYIYDFPVLAVPVAFLMRLGLREGFLRHELAALLIASALILAYPFVSLPTGFVAMLIVAALIVRQARRARVQVA